MSEIFDTNLTFAQFGFSQPLLRGLDEAGFKHPTHIQAKLIPAILAGEDVIGQAKTGTGKTAAFGLPILHQADPQVAMQALILVPTRELAVQVAGEIDELGKHTNLHCVSIIGGESAQQQIRALHKGAQLMVGTPGRIMDLHSRGDLHFRQLRFAVLDEVDRMLDIGFRDDIKAILSMATQPHQTIFCSATIGPEIERLARKFLKPDAKKIVALSGSLTVAMVEQKYFAVEPWDKKQLLLYLLKHEEPDTTVVFCQTKATVHRVTQYLRENGIDVREIHGDLPQKKRSRVMESLRGGKLDVLVASDLAARGLDVDHISHVINYDLSEDPEIYVHRIGRTARAGRKGIAWTFVTSEDGQLLTNVEKLTGVLIEKMEYPKFKPGPVPEDVRLQRQRANVPRKTLDQHMASRVPIRNVDGLSDEELKRRFPDGVIPANLPRKTLGSRLKSRRG